MRKWFNSHFWRLNKDSTIHFGWYNFDKHWLGCLTCPCVTIVDLFSTHGWIGQSTSVGHKEMFIFCFRLFILNHEFHDNKLTRFKLQVVPWKLIPNLKEDIYICVYVYKVVDWSETSSIALLRLLTDYHGEYVFLRKISRFHICDLRRVKMLSSIPLLMLWLSNQRSKQHYIHCFDSTEYSDFSWELYFWCCFGNVITCYMSLLVFGSLQHFIVMIANGEVLLSNIIVYCSMVYDK